MDKLTLFALKNNRFTQLLLVLIIIIGSASFFNAPSKEDPEILVRTAVVVAQIPGMSPERIERLLTKPIEREAKQIPEVSELKSLVRTGYTQIKVTVADEHFDLQPIWDNLRNRMNDLQSSLPEGTIGPMVNDEFGRVASATIALYGDDYSLRELDLVAESIQDRISALSTVSQVDIYGVQDERIWLEPDSDAMSRLGVSPGQLVAALQNQNIVLPGGKINTGKLELTIEPSGNFEALSDIENLVILEPESGQNVYLGDLLSVRRGYVEPQNTPVYYNGKPSVVLAVSMLSGITSDSFGADINQFVTAEQQSLPAGLQFELATFQPDKVATAISSATSNLFQTVAIVLAVVMLFLGFRMGMIVGTIVPLTMMLSFIGMQIWDVSLQRMSIAAIIVSLGLLVDNGIVIAENINTRILQGMKREAAALAASKTLAIPLLTSSLTTILAFMPLMLAQDVAGEYLRSLSQVIIIALLSSWLLSLLVTPLMCVWFFSAKATKQTAMPSWVIWVNQRYGSVLKVLLNYRVSFMAMMLVLLVVAMYGFKFITVQFMPGSERNQYLVYLNLPAGTPTAETDKVTQRFLTWLNDENENPDVTSHITYIGDGGPRFFLALAPVDRASNKAFVVVNTRDLASALVMIEKTNNYIQQQLPEATGQAKRMWLGGSELGLVEYKLQGPDGELLQQKAALLMAGFAEINGVVGITNDWENNIPKILVDVDQDRARRAGISSRDIALSLNGFFDGYKVTDFRDGDRVIPVLLRGNQSRNDFDKLRSVEVTSGQNGVTVPLIQVADFGGESEPAIIRREDQQRTLVVSAKHRQLQASELHQLMQPTLAQLNLPAGYRLRLGGELRGADEASSALFAYMPHCFALIALLLVLQLNSFRRPAVILMTIPLSLIGAVFGLTVTGAFFTFPAMLGMFSLAGVIINNGIVLIDQIETNRKANMLVNEALIEAGKARLRPILMTTLTTILGLIPLAIWGGEFWYSMAIVMIFGMAVGTVLTLGVVPVLYSLFYRSQDIKHQAKMVTNL
ncbi:efflux RND transporter permease subunit [Moritella sp. 24]|uniref:efflux RND transporter permease subunit n=1 Tax=Moritella sp. 24 TaxID=2746230 RepID=UPI001BA55F7E|nr:efflux RND transporter permease subunit [Moritella sp. 24]QUM77916.1 efflux RND transporter permease subunit [Moritella sp. 24]